jgi:hypothetical protein
VHRQECLGPRLRIRAYEFATGPMNNPARRAANALSPRAAHMPAAAVAASERERLPRSSLGPSELFRPTGVTLDAGLRRSRTAVILPGLVGWGDHCGAPQFAPPRSHMFVPNQVAERRAAARGRPSPKGARPEWSRLPDLSNLSFARASTDRQTEPDGPMKSNLTAIAFSYASKTERRR